jgi:hypothetical protein
MGHLDDMSKEELLAFAKERALAELPDVGNAMSSFISDLGKHSEFEGHPVIMLLGMHAVTGNLTESNCRQLIEGTN